LGQIQTIRKALVRIPNYSKSFGPNPNKDLDAKTVNGTIRTDTNLALELLGSKGQN
jgi:hypothetical protein